MKRIHEGRMLGSPAALSACLLAMNSVATQATSRLASPPLAAEPPL